MKRLLPKTLRAAAFPLVSAISSVRAAGPYFQAGSYRLWVSSHLGKPKPVLPEGTWVYPNFEATDTNVHGALLVNFKQGRVTDMRPASGSLVASREK